MEKVSEVSNAVIATLLRDYYLWIGILTLVLAFALYVYFKPNALEFFTGSQQQAKGGDKKQVIPPSEEPTEAPVSMTDDGANNDGV
jgi:hypothetical protein